MMGGLTSEEMRDMWRTLGEARVPHDPVGVRPEVLLARLGARSRRQVERLRARWGPGWPLSVRVMLSIDAGGDSGGMG